MNNLRIVPLADARQLLLRDWPTVAVSLIDTDVKDFESVGPHHLVIRANDVGKTAHVSRADVVKVLEFMAGTRWTERILIHCMMGLSRSPSIAVGVLIGMGMPWEEAFDTVAKMRPQMMPNPDIIAVIDDHFGLDGDLSSRASEWANARLGKPTWRTAHP